MYLLKLFQDLEKYLNFARKYDPAYASKSGGERGGMKINWPNQQGGASNIFANNNAMQNEDDLYN